MKGTKWEIFEVAVNLFANQGFANIGVRDIASVVGIKSASIYNHFENKDAILERVYEYFDDKYYEGLMDIGEILKAIPDTAPEKILDMLSPSRSGKEYQILRKILLIAVTEYNHDPRAKEMLTKMMDVMMTRFTLVLDRMVELKIIDAVDAELFSTVFMSFSISATVSRYNGMHLLPYEKWQEGREMLFRLVLKR